MVDDRRREYQKAYSASRKGDASLLKAYRKKYGVTGAGRPKSAKNKKGVKGWLKVGVEISPEMGRYLDNKKSQGEKKSKIVDDALRLHKDKEGGQMEVVKGVNTGKGNRHITHKNKE